MNFLRGLRNLRQLLRLDRFSKVAVAYAILLVIVSSTLIEFHLFSEKKSILAEKKPYLSQLIINLRDTNKIPSFRITTIQLPAHIGSDLLAEISCRSGCPRPHDSVISDQGRPDAAV